MNALVPTTVPAVLWHYTCPDHGHPAIYGSGKLKPGADGVVWLTDMEFPDRAALGLTRVSLNCDRGARRYRVDETKRVVPWMLFRQQVDTHVRDLLETFPGVMPRHWFVSWSELAAEYDPVSPLQREGTHD